MPTALTSGGNAYHRGWELGYRAYAVRFGIALPERARSSPGSPTTTGLHLDWQTLLYGAPRNPVGVAGAGDRR